MPNFRNAPKYRPSMLVVAMPGDVAQTWDIETEGGDQFVVPDADLRRLAHPIHRQENGAGFYALALENQPAQGFVVDRAEGRVDLEDGSSMELKDFVRRALRVDAEGRTLCAFIEPFHVQHQTLSDAGPRGMAHRFELREAIDHAREEGFTSAVGMYDIITSDLEDDEIPFMDRMRHATAPSWSEHSLEVLQDTGMPVEAWTEIKDTPEYGIDQVRAMFRMLMSPYIGQFPIERVKRIQVGPNTDLAEIIGLALPHLSTDEPFTAGNILRGYTTSDVEHFGNEHVEAVVFSDPGGKYAYAWPRQPKPENAPVADGPTP